MEIASHLRLRDLILFRNASKRLRSAINTNLNSLRPAARRDLLRLWDRVIASPYFLPSRQHVLPALHNFDRAEFLATLSHRVTTTLPAEFETWILEWPARAVIGWVWPGLDEGPYYQPDYNEYHDGPCARVWWQLAGGNPLRITERSGIVPVVYPFTVIDEPSEEGPFLWLKWGFVPLYRRSPDVVWERGGGNVGYGIPVWTVSPGDQQISGYGAGHMLIVSGLGPGYDGTVQLYEEGLLEEDDGPPGRLLIKDTPDDDDYHDWPYRAFHERNTNVWFRGQSWVDWLHTHLDMLEERYRKEELQTDRPLWNWEEWRFRAIDAEHLPT